MKTIITTRGSFLTGSEIADAVTSYGLALARMRDLDVVDVPFVTAEGTLSRAQFTIGWGADTATVLAPERDAELFEIDTILNMLAKTTTLTHALLHASRSAIDITAVIPTESKDETRSQWQDSQWDEFI